MVKANRYRIIIKIGINFIAPVVLLIYLVTALMNLSLISAELGIGAIRYKITIYSSIGITILITFFHIVSKVYPKVSLKRRAIVFIISLLLLIDGFIWADSRLIEIVMEDIGSISVDITLLFMWILILLLINVVIKGFAIFVQ